MHVQASLEGEFADLQARHAQAQSEAQAQVTALEAQLDESCIATAQQLAQVLSAPMIPASCKTI
jgi:hypothetical protein